MSSKRGIRRKKQNASCAGKTAYGTEDQAFGAMMALKKSGAVSGSFNAYQCDFCRQYHFGHVRTAAARTLPASAGKGKKALSRPTLRYEEVMATLDVSLTKLQWLVAVGKLMPSAIHKDEATGEPMFFKDEVVKLLNKK